VQDDELEGLVVDDLDPGDAGIRGAQIDLDPATGLDQDREAAVIEEVGQGTAKTVRSRATISMVPPRPTGRCRHRNRQRREGEGEPEPLPHQNRAT
jgi:hypothetical protein